MLSVPLPHMCPCGGSLVSTVFDFLTASASAADAASWTSCARTSLGPAASFVDLGLDAGNAVWSLDVASLGASVMTGLTAIPEPASCLLFGTGVSGLLALRRRRLRRRG